jgi:transporter family-2 protein
MHPHRGPAVLLALAGGLMAATQARINAQFGVTAGNPSAAAALSATTGLLLLTPVVLLAAPVRRALAALPARVRSGVMPRWVLLPGALGALLLFSQAYAVPALGVALFSVLIVASLTTAGLVVDRVGLGPAGPQAVTTNRVGGAALAIVAAAVAAGPGLSAGSLAILAALVTVAAGTGGSVQSAMLGRLGAGLGHPLAAVWVNFLGAALTLTALVSVAIARGAPLHVPALGWQWLGGPLGVLIVVTIVLAVPRAGVLLVGMAITAGQLLGSLLLDWVAPVEGRAITAWSVAGALLLLGAVILASRPVRPAARHAGHPVGPPAP